MKPYKADYYPKAVYPMFWNYHDYHLRYNKIYASFKQTQILQIMKILPALSNRELSVLVKENPVITKKKKIKNVNGLSWIKELF